MVGAGYHLKEITRGKYGESSKILEETEEFMEARAQGCKIMALMELADLVGAIKGYLDNHAPGFTIRDLEDMAKITERVFKNGHRS
jgi:hypothetical protein